MRDGSPGAAAPTDKPAGDVAISDKVRFLADPAHYPGENRVEVVETHFSWVFLIGNHAYKLKKPVCGDGFDFRAIDARLRNARTEIRLNRRLSPRVYLGIVPLVWQPSGKLQLGGDGRRVDWLVQMLRLEASHMLDQRLSRGEWHYAELEALAYRLAQFFAGATRATITPTAQLALIRRELDRALSAMSIVGEPRLRCTAQTVVRSLDAFIVRHASLFRRRVEDRRLIDGHGDLRPEHVYLKGPPQIIDCLEFRADLRRLDPLSEIAFLGLECDRLGASPIVHRLMRRYRERSNDRPPAALVAFYTALNGLVRSRLSIEHIAEPGTRSREQWSERAASYLAIAAKACRRLSR